MLWVASRAGCEGLFDIPVRRITFIATAPDSEKVKTLKEATTIRKAMSYAPPLKGGYSERRIYALNGQKVGAFGGGVRKGHE